MNSKGLLTELIISTLLFAICAVCAASLLISAYSTSRESDYLLEASELAKDAIEQIHHGVYPDQLTDSGFTVVVNGDWQQGEYFDGVVEVYQGEKLMVSLPCATAVTVEAKP